MKKLFLSLSAVALLAVTGCHTIDGALLDQHQTIAPATTNAVTGQVTPPTTNTTLVPKPAITDALNTANTVAGVLPPPYGDILSGVLALGLGALTLYSRSRNNQLTTQLNTSQQVVQAVVSGVEAVGHPDTKAAIQNAAVAAGVQSALDPIVQTTGQAMK